VVAGSRAAQAGLRVGDRILQVAGRDFADDAAFTKLVATLPGPLELLVERDGQLRAIAVHFAAEPGAVKRAA
jgi:S1-C subfamily serine protease